jgi:hypothetical protein
LLWGCKAPPAKHDAAPKKANAYTWILDPSAPGPDVPPVGKSLFDELVNGQPAYPFERLVADIERQTGARFDRVLIPLGRSLQRSSGGPEFFKNPRVVAALDSEPAKRFRLPVKDRLYMGFQGRASVVEVISYNDRAGRFEFQVVTNYQAGSRPSVTYANRFVCTHCHQNQAPLFPGQLWDETNANPRISRLLKIHANQFHGVPSEQDADVPYRIDKAVHRSNEMSVYQNLWRSGVSTNANDAESVRMRAAWVESMLQYRISGSRRYDSSSASFIRCFKNPLLGSLNARFPAGMAIPNPEIPNRNPLAALSHEVSMDDANTQAFLSSRQRQIEAQFEPANRRRPLELWNPNDPALIDRLVMGGSTLFSDSDIQRVSRVVNSLSVRIQKVTNETLAGKSDCLSASALRPHAICERLIRVSLD